MAQPSAVQLEVCLLPNISSKKANIACCLLNCIVQLYSTIIEIKITDEGSMFDSVFLSFIYFYLLIL